MNTKNTHTNETTSLAATHVTITSLKDLMISYPKLSLKRICDEVNICYQYALKASKQPIANELYDPTKFNYNAVQTIFDRKQIDFNVYNWSEIENSVKTFAPLNKLEEFDIGVEFTMRSAKSTCAIVLMNCDDANNVIEIVFKDYENNKLRIMNVDTFLHQSPRIIK